MRAPRFWWRSPEDAGLMPRLLSPLSSLYALGTARRLQKGIPYKASIPVVCVGNLSVGGTGKTPTVIALLEKLPDRKAHIVTRGYGGQIEGPVLVDPTHHTAADVGDEPLLLAAFAPVWVAKDRAAGAKAAEAAGAEVIIFDDGFQNPALTKDLSIIVVDARRGFGNGRVLPAGPLREPVDVGLSRADLLVSLGDTDAQHAFHPPPNVPRATGEVAPLAMGMDWTDMPVVAFAGIGEPEKFFRSLAAEGAKLVRTVPLDDHQPFSPALLTRLEREARETGAQLVTTEKDAQRLPPEFRRQVLTLVVRLRWFDSSALDQRLATLFS